MPTKQTDFRQPSKRKAMLPHMIWHACHFVFSGIACAMRGAETSGSIGFLKTVRAKIVPALIILALTLITHVHFALPANAAVGTWQVAEGGYVEGRLITAVNSVGDLKSIPAALELKIKPGWKTYWRSPGDAGLPPRLNWDASQNLANAKLAYPAPERFELFGLQTFGYSERVLFPIELAILKPSQELALAADVELLVCEKICVPQTLKLALQLPTGPTQPDTETTQRINQFQNKVPRKGPTPDLEIADAKAITNNNQSALRIAIESKTPLNKPDVFVETDPYIAFNAPTIALSNDRRSAIITLKTTDPLPVGQTLANRTATLTLTDNSRAIEQRLSIKAGSPQSWLASLMAHSKIILLAILGGLILNLMPCVLPVLSIKLLSFVNYRDASKRQVRISFLATAAGIISSMLMIALILIALKSAGQTIGWGIQFQQPVFIAAMAVIVTLFACNLWGFFEIVLPARLSKWVGQSTDAEHGVLGEFTAGAFATLLATPCSAPFIGTAVGFALAGGTSQILIIFAALGVGLAVPYLAIAFVPRLVHVMPKPGAWMVTFRTILGFALAATAIWLLTVLAGQLGLSGTAFVAGLLLALIAILGLPLRSILTRPVATILATILCFAAIFSAFFISPRQKALVTSEFADRIQWQAFDRNAIKSLISQGQIIFVDVTADWCITCKTNKSLAIDTDAVSKRLSDNVVTMRADWTLPSDEISAFLANYGRFGIPFNIVYGPGAPRGHVLPELLTPNIIMQALDKASGQQQTGAEKELNEHDPS